MFTNFKLALLSSKCFFSPFFLQVVLWNFSLTHRVWQCNLCVFLFVLYYLENRGNPLRLSVLICSFSLGLIGTFSLDFAFNKSNPAIPPLAIISLLFCCFHFAEFLITALISSGSVQIFNLINNFSFYLWINWFNILAAFLSLVEYFGEAYAFGNAVKFTFGWTIFTGVGVCLVGQIFRVAAFWIAGTYRKAQTNQFHHRGIYKAFRHPQYVGMYCCIIGLQVHSSPFLFIQLNSLTSFAEQLILSNPICLNILTVIIWFVLKRQIAYEDAQLTKSFGPKYLQYKKKVPSGLPFIS